MSNKVSEIKVAEEVKEEVNTTVNQIADNLTEEDQAKLAELVSQQTIVESKKENPLKKGINWIKKHKWLVAGALGGALAIGYLGKKAYDAGMPAEFDANSDIIDADFKVTENVDEYENTPEVEEVSEDEVVE